LVVVAEVMLESEALLADTVPQLAQRR